MDATGLDGDGDGAADSFHGGVVRDALDVVVSRRRRDTMRTAIEHVRLWFGENDVTERASDIAALLRRHGH
jgi:hypothetical protein